MSLTTRVLLALLAGLARGIALASWLFDHDTDSFYKIARAFVDGQPAGNLTRDHILDNVMLYWLTSTGASAARSYWEDGRAAVRVKQTGLDEEVLARAEDGGVVGRPVR